MPTLNILPTDNNFNVGQGSKTERIES